MAKKSALIVGVNRYRNISSLRYAAGDAREWKDQIGPEFEFRELYDNEATKDNILNGLRGLVEEPCDSNRSLRESFLLASGVSRAEFRRGFSIATPSTVANEERLSTRTRELTVPAEEIVSQEPCIRIFVFAGHGCNVQRAGLEEPDRLDEALCPFDTRAVPAGGAFYGVRETVITDNEIVATLGNLPENVDMYLIYDSCNSGDPGRNLVEPVNYDPPYRGISPLPVSRRRIRAIPRACWLTAALENETTPDNPSFTDACMEALRVPELTPAQVIESAKKKMERYGSTPQLYDGAGLANEPIFKGRRTRQVF